MLENKEKEEYRTVQEYCEGEYIIILRNDRKRLNKKDYSIYYKETKTHFIIIYSGRLDVGYYLNR